MAVATLFDVQLIDGQLPNDSRIEEIIRWARLFFERGWTPSYGPGDHGNFSCRTQQGLLVTARETSKNRLTAEHFAEVFEESQVDKRPVLSCRGKQLPSTDALMHLRIYRARPEIQAIFHGHDPATLANAQKLELPVTSVSARTASWELVEEVLRLAAKADYLIMRDHGFLALGRSISAAGELAVSWANRGKAIVAK